MTIDELKKLADMVAFLDCEGIKCKMCPLNCSGKCVSVKVKERIDELERQNIDRLIKVFLR